MQVSRFTPSLPPHFDERISNGSAELFLLPEFISGVGGFEPAESQLSTTLAICTPGGKRLFEANAGAVQEELVCRHQALKFGVLTGSELSAAEGHRWVGPESRRATLATQTFQCDERLVAVRSRLRSSHEKTINPTMNATECNITENENFDSMRKSGCLVVVALRQINAGRGIHACGAKKILSFCVVNQASWRLKQ